VVINYFLLTPLAEFEHVHAQFPCIPFRTSALLQFFSPRIDTRHTSGYPLRHFDEKVLDGLVGSHKPQPKNRQGQRISRLFLR